MGAMGTAAAVLGDKITATCNGHQMPNPATGAPQPAPPMPFSAPLIQGLATTVMIGGKFAAVIAKLLHEDKALTAKLTEQANPAVESRIGAKVGALRPTAAFN